MLPNETKIREILARHGLTLADLKEKCRLCPDLDARSMQTLLHRKTSLTWGEIEQVCSLCAEGAIVQGV